MRSRLLTVLLLVVLAAGCGDDTKPGASTSPSADDNGWSTPERVPPAIEAGPITPAAMLERVTAQIRSGQALQSVTWSQDLDALADLLFPPADDGQVPAAVGDMHRLLHAAGDVARMLHARPEERVRLAQDRAIDLATHDEALAALEQGVDAFRTWVGEGGQELLRAKAAWLEAQFLDR